MSIRKSGGPRDDLFERLYRKYYARTYRFFRQTGVADDEAHELSQETFTTIYRNFDAYRGEAEWSYIATVARRALLNWIRAKTAIMRSATMVSIDDDEKPFDVEAPETLDYAEKELLEKRTQRLHEAISDLPDGQRHCLQLWLADRSYDEITTCMKISVDTVKSRLREARRTLRQRLGEMFPEDDQ